MLGLVLSKKIHLGWVNRQFGHFSRKKYLVGMVFDGLLSMLACLVLDCHRSWIMSIHSNILEAGYGTFLVLWWMREFVCKLKYWLVQGFAGLLIVDWLVVDSDYLCGLFTCVCCKISASYDL